MRARRATSISTIRAGSTPSSGWSGTSGRPFAAIRDKNGTPEDLAAILAAVAVDFRQFESADGIRIPTGINLFTGRRP